MTREELAGLPIEQLKEMALQKVQAEDPRAQLAKLPIEELKKMAIEKTLKQEEMAAARQDGAPQRQLQAGVEGFGQGATFGYLPQIQAGLETATNFFDKFKPGTPAYVDEELKKQGFTIDQPGDTYLERRDENLRRQKGLQEEFPLTYSAGQVGGTIATALATGGAGTAGKVLSTGEKLKRAALVGGAYGAAQNPGDTEGEISPLQLGDRLENALKGAATGAAISGLAQVGGKIVDTARKIPGWTKNYSYDQAIGAIGGERGSIKKILNQERINLREAGKDLIENKIVEAGDDIEKMHSKLVAVTKKTGEKIGEITNYADDFLSKAKTENLTPKQIKVLQNSKVSMVDFAKEMEQKLSKQLKGAGKTEAMSKAKAVLAELADEGDDVSAEMLRTQRQSVDEFIDWGKANNEMAMVDRTLKIIRNELKSKITKKIAAADYLSGKRTVEAFDKANKDYSKYLTLQGLAKNKLASNKGANFMGMSELILSGTGTTLGGLPGMAAGIAMSRAIKKWGASTGAVGLGKVADILAKDPVKLGRYSRLLNVAYKKNPQALPKIVADLLAGDSEFKKKVDSIKDKRSWEK